MMPEFTRADILRAFSPSNVARGMEYARAGRVDNVFYDDANNRLVAFVKGTAPEPYQVTIHLHGKKSGSVRLDAFCTCPVGNACKHGAAVLLKFLDRAPDSAPIMDSVQDDWQLQAWLKELEKTLAPQTQTYPKNIAERLLYILHRGRFDRDSRKLFVNAITVRKLADGGYGKEQPFRGNHLANARYILENDRDILRWLTVMTPAYLNGEYVLEGRDAASVLRSMLSTGRCHWENKDAPALQLGEPRSARIEWRVASDGSQTPRCVFVDGGVPITFAVEPPYYLDLATHSCGPVQTALPEPLATTLLRAPAIPAQHLDEINNLLSEKFPDGDLPRPQALEIAVTRTITPVPVVDLYVKKVPLRQRFYYSQREGTLSVEVLRLRFDYEGEIVGLNENANVISRVVGDKLQRIARNKAFEQQAANRLIVWGFRGRDPSWATDSTAHELSDDALLPSELIVLGDERQQQLIDFSLKGAPELQADGWRVHFDANYPFRMVHQVDDWYANLQDDDGEGNQWFTMELGAVVDGKKVNILPALLNALDHLPQGIAGINNMIAEHKPLFVRMDDGSLLQVPADRAQVIVKTLLELYDVPVDKHGRMQLSTIHVGPLAELDAIDTPWRWHGSSKWLDLGHRLKDFTGIASVAPPAGLNATLRSYQQHGLNWLQFLRSYDLAGILADDMGLGKTVQTLAHVLIEKENNRLQSPALVVAPTSVIVNWRREIATFAPSLSVLVLHGADRHTHFKDIHAYDIVLTTYPLLTRDQDVLTEQQFHLIILDEAHVVKNPRAKSSQVVRQLRGHHRLCLTGTPMENHLGELWSLFDFLLPGMLGSEPRFRSFFRTPIEKHGDQERRELLRRRISPFMLRRTKQDVVRELPPKTEIIRNVELTGGQRDLYETIRLAMNDKVRKEIAKKGVARSHIIILEALLKLRQVCCDPRLLSIHAAAKVTESAKLTLLMEMLPELIEEGRKILLFSQFTSMLALIEEGLEKLKIDYVILTGETKDRATPIERFQRGDVPLFLISLKAGGVGLNLTAADVVIHYDPWWNPAVEAQATDRAYRIGQDKPVFVYKLVSASTVEEKILALQDRKKELAQSIYTSGESEEAQFTNDDLDALLAPLAN